MTDSLNAFAINGTSAVNKAADDATSLAAETSIVDSFGMFNGETKATAASGTVAGGTAGTAAKAGTMAGTAAKAPFIFSRNNTAGASPAAAVDLGARIAQVADRAKEDAFNEFRNDDPDRFNASKSVFANKVCSVGADDAQETMAILGTARERRLVSDGTIPQETIAAVTKSAQAAAKEAALAGVVSGVGAMAAKTAVKIPVKEAAQGAVQGAVKEAVQGAVKGAVKEAVQEAAEEKSVYDMSLGDIFSRLGKNKTVKGSCSAAMRGIQYLKMISIIKTFEKGQLIDSGDFMFLKAGNELMLLKYSGADMDLRIPSKVGNVPVTYLHPDFLCGGFGVLNNYKARGLKSYLAKSTLQPLNGDDIKQIGSGLRSITLPNTLRVLPNCVFAGVRNVKRLVLPASVTYVAPDAFERSCIEQLFFNGYAPHGLKHCLLPKELFTLPQFKKSFRGL